MRLWERAPPAKGKHCLAARPCPRTAPEQAKPSKLRGAVGTTFIPLTLFRLRLIQTLKLERAKIMRMARPTGSDAYVITIDQVNLNRIFLQSLRVIVDNYSSQSTGQPGVSNVIIF